MQKRTLKVALLAVLSIVLVLGLSTVALADQTWSDLPDSVTAKYGVDDNQVAAISDGFAGDLWKPYQSITRAQFTKMAVAAFDIPLVDAATASFTDVPKGSYYYPYVEGAKAAGIVNGSTATTFGASTLITRQQALAIIARYVADAAGYDLATMYSTDEIAALVAHFGDAASISADLKDEMAFAFDFGITVGNDYGNLEPLANLTRIQGAVMLIRAQAKVPPATWTAANIELVSEDETENLIGQVHSATFEVTTADGHPAKNVLVDFDTLFGSDFYVGNISQQAALTNNYGQVTINLLSTEPGTQRVAATVAGVGTVYTSQYWVAMDEVYITDSTREFENNAGDSQTLSARVVVFGPGPLSTSAQDWYNAIDADTTGALAAVDWPIGFAVAELMNLYRNVLPVPGSMNDWKNSEIVEWALAWWDAHEDVMDDYPGEVWDLLNLIISTDRWSYDVELLAAVHGYAPRGMAGISTDWSLVNVVDDNPATKTVDETVPSVGAITAADEVTDADGLTSCTIKSTEKGDTKVQVLADYAENPYPGQLFNHLTSQIGLHFLDWDDQPLAQATAILTWIPHVLPSDSDAPIEPTYAVNNVGEVEEFVLTLKDVYGNLIDGYTVEWWIQGVGFFKSDTSTWVGTGEQNKDVDVTVNGIAKLDLKSLVPGQTIVHCKVMDKYGLPYKEWNVVKQWYSIDDVTFGLFDKDGDFYADDYEENVVDTTHTWYLSVDGAKYVYTIYDLNKNGLRDDEVLIGDRADMKAKAGVYANFDGTVGAAKAAGVDPAVGIPFMPSTGDTWYVRFADMEMLDNEFWVDMIGTVADGSDADSVRDDDGIDEVWAGLEGKTVYFYNNQFLDNTLFDTAQNSLVGTITSSTKVVTDELGFASVDIKSTNKGLQTVLAVVDYDENPQDGDPLKPTQFKELRWDCASKLWLADYTSDGNVKIFANGILGEANGYRWTNPILEYSFTGTVPVTISEPTPVGTLATGTATVGTGGVTAVNIISGGTGYTQSDVGQTVTIAAPPSAGSGATAVATIGGTPTDNQVAAISVTNGGTGYAVAPTVVIGAPQIAGGTQAVATANVAGGSVVSVTVTNPGSGYTSAPTVSFDTGVRTATATIATVTGDAVGTVTVTNPGSGYTNAPTVTFPMPLKTRATASATATNGVITAVNLITGGAGYTTPPAVIFGGTGTGAAATANIASGAVTSFNLVSGGTGYLGASTVDSSTEKSANPNRETLCVSVFDKYGNALQGYKVTFEIVGQGTTTAGTVPTYHPYAHFEDPEHDIDRSGTANDLWCGLGDLNPYLNVNPYWNRLPDLIPGNATDELSDDDYAWGYTLNHEINFVTNPEYAACVDLVLDETRAQLANKSHITDIVNIQVFDPNGVRIMHKEVTKVWSTEQPVLTTVQMSVSTNESGPWSTAVAATTIQPIRYRVQLFDQYGAPFTGAVPALKLRFASAVNTWNVALTTPDTDGVIIGTVATPPSPLPSGTYTFQAWNDSVVTDGLVGSTELASNLATYILQ